MRDGDETVEFQVRVKKITDSAILVRTEGVEVWFPKSQIDLNASDVSEEGDTGTLVVSEWIAKEKSLI